MRQPWTYGLLTWAVLSACGTDTPTNVAFAEVTQSQLPVASVAGFCADAQVVDVEADGDLDLILANDGQPNVLLINDGTGLFTDQSAARIPQLSQASRDINVADFDGNGDIDIFVATGGANELYLSNGNGSFRDASGQFLPAGDTYGVVAFDVEGDGDVDVVLGNAGQNVLALNTGNGNFFAALPNALPPRLDLTQDLEAGDIDNDGDVDVLVANEDANVWWTNQGGGVFTLTVQPLPLRTNAEETREAALGDFDQDGDLDAVFANSALTNPGADMQNRFLLSNGGGSFSDVTERLPTDTDNSTDVELLDVDGDGFLDILTANAQNLSGIEGTTPFRAYINQGGAFFREATAQVFPATAVGNGMDIAAGDFNGDGLVDLYLCNRGGPDRLLFQVGD